MTKALIALFLLAATTLAHADDATNWVNFGGLSYHIPAKDYNDANYGLGIEHAINDTWGVVGGTYYNSLRVQAYYVGARYIFKKDCFLGGECGALVYASTGYQNNGVPAVLPFLGECWKYGCVMSNGIVSTAMLRIPVKAF